MLAVSLGWAAVAAVILLLRQTGVPATDTIWAEDGQVFLGQALDRGPLEVLFRPAEGYLSLAPRVVGGLVSLAPLELSSALLAVGAAVVLGLLSVYTLLASASILRTRWARAVLAALVVLLPALAWESMNNVTNLQWSFLLPGFVALLASPRTPAATWAGSAVAFATAASAPVAAAYLPLAGIHLVRSRAVGRGATIAWAFVAGMALEGSVILTARWSPGLDTSLADLPGLYGLRVAASLFGGEWILPFGWRFLGWGLAWAALALGAVVLGYGAMRFPSRRGRCLLALGASVVTFSLAVFARGTSLLVPPAAEFHLHGSRWVIGPTLLLTLAILIVLEMPHPGAGRWLWAGIRSAFVLAVLVAVVLGFRVDNARSDGPRWKARLQEARAACGATGGEDVIVSITPPGWSMRVPCGRPSGG